MYKVKLFAALLLFVIVSCDLEHQLYKDLMKEVSITASCGEETKTSYSDSGAFSWTKGDQISVLGSDDRFYTLTALSAGSTTTFKGSVPANVELGDYALYPANDNHTYNKASADRPFRFYIEESKDLTGNGSADLPMTAKKQNDSYPFKHLTGGFKFTFTDIPAEYESVLIRFQDPNKISGLYSLRWSSSSQCWVSMGGTAYGDENTYERKVSVKDGVATIFLPCSYEYALSSSTSVEISGVNSSGSLIALLNRNVDLSKVQSHTRGKMYIVPALSLKDGEQEIPPTLCMKEFLGQTPMIIAYYTENSSSVPDPACLTHINYAHGRFVEKETGDGGIWIEQPEKLQKVVALKKNKPQLKVLLMIGGWGDKADGFSEMARDADKRALFCQSCAEHIRNYNLDGIDIDWEYPTAGPSENGKHPDDTKNFNLVLKELRQAIGNTKIISYASASNADYVDWETAMQYIDYVNVMTYDMGDPPYHNAPLYYSSAITRKRSVDQSISLHMSAGIPSDRLVMGVPFYGHGTDPYKSDVKFNEMSGIFSSSKYEGKNIRKWDSVAKVPYLADTAGNMLLGYDDEESVTCKGEYVKQKNLLGAMFWEYRHDDSQGTLRKALCRAIYGKDSTLNN